VMHAALKPMCLKVFVEIDYENAQCASSRYALSMRFFNSYRLMNTLQ
jgi:hypothetical protein